MFFNFFFPLALLLLAVGFLGWHVTVWRALQREGIEGAELQFGRRQFRRRMQVSAMLALLAVGLFVGQLIPARERPTAYVIFWCGVLLLLAWMVSLALGDLVISRQRFERLRHERRIAEAQLTAELSRIRAERAAGQEGDEHAPPP